VSFLSLNGSRAVTGRVTLPPRGIWTAQISLAESEAIPSDVNVMVGDLSLSGTAFRAASFAGARSVLIVGGKAGWRKPVSARGYTHEAGVKLSSVLGDVASDVGETIVLESDVAIGPSFTRRRDIAERVLRRLTGGDWWIAPDGRTRVGPRDSSRILSPFTIEKYSGAEGRFHIATENYADWQPGRTFTAPTVTTPQTISSVSITADNDGQVRLEVLTGPSTEDRLHDRIRAIVQDEMSALEFSPTWAYRVAPYEGLIGLSSALDVTPEDPSMPALLRVPLAPELGEVAAPLTGTRCRVRFRNGDPAQPEICALGATTETPTSIDTVALLIYNVFCELAIAQPAVWTGPVVQAAIAAAVVSALTLQGTTPAPPGIVAQVAAAAAQSGNFASGTPATTSAPFSAVIATAVKKLNVSGLFPGLGVPSNG